MKCIAYHTKLLVITFFFLAAISDNLISLAIPPISLMCGLLVAGELRRNYTVAKYQAELIILQEELACANKRISVSSLSWLPRCKVFGKCANPNPRFLSRFWALHSCNGRVGQCPNGAFSEYFYIWRVADRNK